MPKRNTKGITTKQDKTRQAPTEQTNAHQPLPLKRRFIIKNSFLLIQGDLGEERKNAPLVIIYACGDDIHAKA
jgi:hypothetical protein